MIEKTTNRPVTSPRIGGINPQIRRKTTASNHPAYSNCAFARFRRQKNRDSYFDSGKLAEIIYELSPNLGKKIRFFLTFVLFVPFRGYPL